MPTALAQLGRRENWTGDDDLVFAGPTGSYLDGSALLCRCRAALAGAGLRPLRFYDLRHTVRMRMITKADIRRVQEWMGHSNIQTTLHYLHHAPRGGRPPSRRGFRRRHVSGRLRASSACLLQVGGLTAAD